MDSLTRLLQAGWHHVSLQPILLALAFAVLLSTFLPSRTARALKTVPGPYSYPVLGNLGDWHFKGFHNCLLESLLKYGPVFKYKVGRFAVLNVADPEIVQQVGVRMFKTFHDRMMPGNFNVGFYDKGLVFGKGKYWVGLRNSVVPLFHSAKLRNFGKTMHACAGQLVQRLKKAAEKGEQVNMLEWAAQMTLDTLGTSAFGVAFNNQAEEETEGLTLVKAMNGILASVARPSFSGVLSLLVPSLGKAARLLLAQVPGTHEFADMQRTAYLFGESQKIIEARRKDVSTAERHDFLSMLMQARDKTTGEPLSDEVIGGLVSEFIRVGTDTTATTIAFAVYLLSSNPAAEEKMCREIRVFFDKLEKEVAADEEPRPSYDELGQFPYVEQVIQETLRIYPTILNTIREANEDCHVAGVDLPKGAIVAMPVYAMHRNPAIFPNPAHFRPERFDPEEVAKRHPYAYIPFGVGPRMCIGQRFAMEEAKLALIRLYQRLTFTVVKEKVVLPNGEVDVQVGNALKPRNGMWVVPKVRLDVK